MATAADLPIELHAEILKGLHHHRDRHTLLSVALVNKNWSKEAQYIIFSTVTDHWHDNAERKNRVTLTHARFLQTIAEHPDRLGPLVKSYAQKSMACNPAATAPIHGFPKSTFDLWQLTAKALPAMINLKHLYLEPVIDSWPANDDWVSSSALLHSFTFHLDTLTWKNYYHPRNGFAEFLRTQHSIVHLENGQSPDWGNLSWIDDDTCPRLTSVSCGFNSFAHVAKSKKIIAWKWYTGTNEMDLVQHNSSALDPLKYLSVSDYKYFRDVIGPVKLNIILLELSEGAWEKNTVASLADMPSLRVLVLIQGMYSTVNGQEIMRSAIDCFGRFPSLEYIIQRYSHRYWNEYSYLKLTPHPDSTEDILREELLVEYNIGAPWWSIYNI